MKDDAVNETFVSTKRGFVRVVWDWRGGTKRVRAFLNGEVITDEYARSLGVNMDKDGGVAGDRPSAMGF